MKLIALASLVALVGCAAASESSTKTDDVTQRKKTVVSGYDLEGPKVLPSDTVLAEFCAAVVSEVRTACAKAGGASSRVNGCGDLCSVPIAAAGKTAGYGFEGYVQVSDDEQPTACSEVVLPEASACEKAGGKLLSAGDCRSLCTKPIAEKGKVAGYDTKGFKVLPAATQDTVCIFVVSEVEMRCDAVGGTSTAAADCATLCSHPF